MPKIAKAPRDEIARPCAFGEGSREGSAGTGAPKQVRLVPKGLLQECLRAHRKAR